MRKQINLMIIFLFIIFIQGCTPKLGKDIFVSINKDDIKLENSKTDVSMTILSFIGLPFDKTPIKLSGYLSVDNKWWKDIEVKSITYELTQNDMVVAKGNAQINKYFIIHTNKVEKIPLTLVIDTKNITPMKMIKRLSNIEPLKIRGTVTISAFGQDFNTNFENTLS